jgi:CheY-like chemotaxis protein
MDAILLIDDHNDFREGLAAVLREYEFKTLEARTVEEAFQVLDSEPVSLALCDLELPFTLTKEFFDYQYSCMVGARSIAEIHWAKPQLPIIAMTGLPSSLINEVRHHIPTIPLLQKPFSYRQVLQMIEMMVAEPQAAVMQ